MLLSEVGRGRLMMGLEGWDGSIFGAPLQMMIGRVCGPLTFRTHLTRRPREDTFLPEQNWLNFLSALSTVHAA